MTDFRNFLAGFLLLFILVVSGINTQHLLEAWRLASASNWDLPSQAFFVYAAVVSGTAAYYFSRQWRFVMGYAKNI